MSQLYKFGIIIAIILFVLLALSKLNGNQNNNGVQTQKKDAVSTEVETKEVKNNKETNMSEEKQENTIVTLKTNKGDIKIELFTKDMPITAGNFLKLAKEDFYDGIKFHRVIDGFMIQAGDPNSKDDTKQNLWGTGGPGYSIEDEFVPGYSNVRGTIAMANAGPNTGGSQFFINLVDNVNLDYDKQPLTSKHPVFGRVVDGMDVVDTIGHVQTGPRDVPSSPVIIEDIVIES
jgi:peptidylprolyl isomerase